MKTTVSTLTALALLCAPAAAQDVESSLAALAEANARPYLAPLLDGLGHALSGGLAESAEPLGRFGVRVGVRVSAALYERQDAAFEAVLPSSITWNGTTYADPYEADGSDLRTPTAVGKGTGIVLRPRRGSALERDLILAEENPTGPEWEVRLPDGFDIPAAPTAVFEGSLGLGFGTELTVSLLPSVELGGDVGSIRAIGGALLHDVDRYLPGPVPVDLALLAGWRRLEVGDYAEVRAATFGAVASRDLTPLTVYAQAMVTSASADVRYTVENAAGNPALPAAGSTVSFTSEPGAAPRLAVGAVLDLVLLGLSAEYALADYDTFALKLSLSLR